MQKWEYLRLRAFGTGQAISSVNGKGTWNKGAVEIGKDQNVDEALALLGAHGWEIVGIAAFPNTVMDYMYIFLKRPLDD